MKDDSGDIEPKATATGVKRFLQHLYVIVLVLVGFFGSPVAFVYVFAAGLWVIPFLVIGILSVILGYKLAGRWDIELRSYE